MIRIENIVLGMCATNCYAVFDGGAKTPGGYVDDGQLKEAVIIDPALFPALPVPVFLAEPVLFPASFPASLIFRLLLFLHVSAQFPS